MMGPSLGEAKRAALRNMQPPKDNLLWQFTLQEKLTLIEEKIEKLSDLPQRMVELEERIDSIRNTQDDTRNQIFNNDAAVTRLEAENMALGMELERLSEKVIELERTVRGQVLERMMHTNERISVINKENEALSRRLDSLESQHPPPRLANNQQSRPCSGMQERLSSKNSTDSSSNQPIQSNPTDRLRRAGIKQQERMENSGSPRSSIVSNPTKMQSPTKPHTINNFNAFDPVNNSAAGFPGSSRSTRNVRSGGLAEPYPEIVPASQSQSNNLTKQVIGSNDLTNFRGSENSYSLVQGNKSLVQYFDETSKEVLSKMDKVDDEMIAKNWMNGLADKNLSKDLQMLTMQIAKARGEGKPKWKDVDEAIWLPMLKRGMVWAHKKESEKENAKNKEMLLARKAEREASAAPPAKRGRR